jgi:hypothetical protein
MSDRPQTGPMRFGDDWAGVFMRGDHAVELARSIRRAIAGEASGQDWYVLDAAANHIEASKQGSGMEPQQLEAFSDCVVGSKAKHQLLVDALLDSFESAVAMLNVLFASNIETNEIVSGIISDADPSLHAEAAKTIGMISEATRQQREYMERANASVAGLRRACGKEPREGSES